LETLEPSRTLARNKASKSGLFCVSIIGPSLVRFLLKLMVRRFNNTASPTNLGWV